MPSDPEWMFQYRWNDILSDGLIDVDKLEERDRALEKKLKSFGGSCSIDFEYPYRWDQILSYPPHIQSELIETRTIALENAITSSGGCRLELPYRWGEIWPMILAFDPDGLVCAEENDKVIEERFSRCTCFEGYLITTGDNFCTANQSNSFTPFVDDDLITQIRVQGTTTYSGTWMADIRVNGIVVESVSLPGGTFDVTTTISVPILFGDVVDVQLSTSFDPGTDIVTFTSSTLNTTVTSNNFVDSPIGATEDYVMTMHRLGSLSPFDILDTDTKTIPGTDVTVPHASVSNSLSYSDVSTTFGDFDLNTTNALSPTVSYDVTSVNVDYTKVGTFPMRVSLTVHEADGSSWDDFVIITSPGSGTLSVTPSPEGPFFGPVSGFTSDFNYFYAEGTSGAPTPCISNVTLFVEGEGEDTEVGWISV